MSSNLKNSSLLRKLVRCYPASFDQARGQRINARIYHAGTKKNEKDEWEANGGRVLALVAGGQERQEAVNAAYAELQKISFDGAQKRTDIGLLHF